MFGPAVVDFRLLAVVAFAGACRSADGAAGPVERGLAVSAVYVDAAAADVLHAQGSRLDPATKCVRYRYVAHASLNAPPRSYGRQLISVSDPNREMVSHSR